MANVTIDQLTGKTSVATDQLEVQATAGGASNKVTVASAVTAGAAALTPQSNTKAIGVTGYSLTGADATPMIDLAGTWSTSGTTAAIRLNLIDSASNASSMFADFLIAGASKFQVLKSGLVYTAIGLSQGIRGYYFIGNGLRLTPQTGPSVDLSATDFTPSITATTTLGTTTLRWKGLYLGGDGVFAQTPVSFSALTAASTAGTGARAFISDGAATPVFSSPATAGGTLVTPVYSDGTTWRNG